MTVFPDHPIVRDFLTLQYREMIKEGRRTRFETLRAPMFQVTSVRGQAAIFSHQGFWKSLADELTKQGFAVSVQDMRPQILEPPNYAAAIQGLREYQQPWIIKALKNGNSGLLGAPTRFGKSYGMTAICRAFPNAKIVVTAPGVDLCRQLHEHFQEVLPRRETKGVYTGSRNSKQSDDITICSIDSLDKMDPDDTDILILDEPHAAVSEERKPKVEKFVRARKYGFGATLNGRFDKKDRLIEGLIGPIISNISYKEGVELGAISPLKVLFVKIPFSKDTIPGRFVDRDIVYQRLLTKSTRTAALTRKILHEVIPDHWQTMAFIQNEKQALFYLEHAILPAGTELPQGMIHVEPGTTTPMNPGDVKTDGANSDYLTREEYLARVARQYGTIAMAKRMKAAERKSVTQGIVDNKIWRVLASNIYVQGLTFPDLKVVVNLAGGGANTTAIQKPGRLLQTRPGKNYGVLVDFMFDCKDKDQETRSNPPWSGVVGECWARHKAYEEIGYDIEFVEDSDRAREVILGAYDSDDPSPAHPGPRATWEP